MSSIKDQSPKTYQRDEEKREKRSKRKTSRWREATGQQVDDNYELNSKSDQDITQDEDVDTIIRRIENEFIANRRQRKQPGQGKHQSMASSRDRGAGIITQLQYLQNGSDGSPVSRSNSKDKRSKSRDKCGHCHQKIRKKVTNKQYRNNVDHV